jgi:hypothetical protein
LTGLRKGEVMKARVQEFQLECFDCFLTNACQAHLMSHGHQYLVRTEASGLLFRPGNHPSSISCIACNQVWDIEHWKVKDGVVDERVSHCTASIPDLEYFCDFDVCWDDEDDDFDRLMWSVAYE